MNTEEVIDNNPFAGNKGIEGEPQANPQAILSEQEKAELLSMNISEEYRDIAYKLSSHHAFFYKMWDIGRPTLTLSIPTAAVAFNKKGNYIQFLFNPVFWKELDTYSKSFVISHECLHVLLNHGIRSKDCESAPIANVALDVVVNHMLCDKFGFVREKVKDWQKYCWLDTVFKDFDDVEKDQIFEYYYNILKNNVTIKKFKIFINIGGKDVAVSGEVIDSHDGLSGLNSEELQKEIQEALDHSLNDEEKQDLAKKLNKCKEGKKAAETNSKDPAGQQAGTVAGNLVASVSTQKVAPKKKWETVIQKWSKKYIHDLTDLEQWARLNRRLQFVGQSGLCLPSDYEEDHKDESKIDVYFFLDTSGSCLHLKDRFFTAAKSLPTDRFNLHLHCFDTKVYEVDIKKGELYGFGGTSFNIIEAYIQSNIISKKTNKYPEAVFLITDGYGDAVAPAFPKKWYWFLSVDYRQYIPKDSNVYMLNKFE